LLSRTRIVSSARPATSTQLPLYVLNELFTQGTCGLSPERPLISVA
jgi:hypothetical protein